MARRIAWFLPTLALAACVPEAPPTAPAAAAPAAPAAPAATPGSRELLARLDELKDQVRDRPRDHEIDLALANLYFDNGRFVEAVDHLRQALAPLAPAEQRIAELKAAGRLPAARPPPPECAPRRDDKAARDPARTPEAIIARAKELEAKDPKAAAACWGALSPLAARVHALRGNAWYLAGNPDEARREHETALALNPDEPESLFYLGAEALDAAQADHKLVAEARARWERLLRAAPDHPRAAQARQALAELDRLAAGGGADAGTPGAAAADATAPAPLDDETVQAMAAAATPEALAQVDEAVKKGEALLAQRRWKEALEEFKAAMPVRTDGRVALGMGIALRELASPMAARVLEAAATMPGGDAKRARFELARALEQGDPARARALYSELATDPRYGDEAKARGGKLAP